MNLTVAPISFKANNNSDKNPISRKGEAANLVNATFIAGLGLGTKLLFELLDDEFLLEHAYKTADKMVNKKDISNTFKRSLCKIGGTIGLLVAGVASFALVYTLFKSPNIAYESKVNTFTKGNDMDVFIKKNQVEQGIYEQLSSEAKKENNNKDELKKLYAQMEIAQDKK